MEIQFLQTLCAWDFGFPGLVHLSLIKKVFLNRGDYLSGYAVTLSRIRKLVS
jgi:hypothetical protein